MASEFVGQALPLAILIQSAGGNACPTKMREIGDISIQVYSQGNLVAEGSGLPATMRRTIEQGAGALMWSVRMIGVALAFLAPWIIALAAAIGIVRGIRRSRRHREN